MCVLLRPSTASHGGSFHVESAVQPSPQQKNRWGKSVRHAGTSGCALARASQGCTTLGPPLLRERERDPLAQFTLWKPPWRGDAEFAGTQGALVSLASGKHTIDVIPNADSTGIPPKPTCLQSVSAADPCKVGGHLPHNRPHHAANLLEQEIAGRGTPEGRRGGMQREGNHCLNSTAR